MAGKWRKWLFRYSDCRNNVFHCAVRKIFFWVVLWYNCIGNTVFWNPATCINQSNITCQERYVITGVLSGRRVLTRLWNILYLLSMSQRYPFDNNFFQKCCSTASSPPCRRICTLCVPLEQELHLLFESAMVEQRWLQTFHTIRHF